MIIGQSPLEAWKAASGLLMAAQGRELYALLIRFPVDTVVDESAMNAYDPRTRLGIKFDRARDVANTVFPLKTWKNAGSREAFYERYVKAHRRGKKKNWGTYFGRFIQFGATRVNQLERVVHALTSWHGAHRAALVMHTSSSETDGLRTRGGPCLQYVQFNCPNVERVDLLAVYRNHDYTNKVLGNFFGLSRLLRFVCDEADRQPGSVTCLSAHAYFGASIGEQNRLLRSS